MPPHRTQRKLTQFWLRQPSRAQPMAPHFGQRYMIEPQLCPFGFFIKQTALIEIHLLSVLSVYKLMDEKGAILCPEKKGNKKGDSSCFCPLYF